MSERTTEQIWVTVKEAAELTGYSPGWMTKWVRDMFALPENERTIQVRQEANRYQLWLPDLMEFVATYAAGRVNTQAEEMWVNTSEAAEFTGYYFDYIQKMARNNWRMEEDQRIIRVRRRAGRYDIWLPDLVKYISEHGHGPYQKPRSK
jgi:hypothetical protein